MGETKREFLQTYGRIFICTSSIRLLVIAKESHTMRLLIDTFVMSMPAIANVGSLLLLIIYIFALLGMQIFSQVNLQENLNENANF